MIVFPVFTCGKQVLFFVSTVSFYRKKYPKNYPTNPINLEIVTYIKSTEEVFQES